METYFDRYLQIMPDEILFLLLCSMIAFLKGNFIKKSPAAVYIDVQGVGYEVQISLNTYSKIQSLESGMLLTHLLIREDAHILYGFFDAAEKEMFLLLLSVSGVGASTARVMLSYMQPDEVGPRHCTRQCKIVGNSKRNRQKNSRAHCT